MDEKHLGILLDIGCGANKQQGWTGMDRQARAGVDVVHDWNVLPWPFPNNYVHLAMASHVVEHVSPIDGFFLRWMDEVWRIMKPGGQLAIVTPHGYSPGYLQDPTHCNPCNEVTWAYFDPEEPRGNGLLWRIYRPRPWQVKFVTWDPSANIEVVMVKREINEEWYRD